jgi:hypothetical protein
MRACNSDASTAAQTIRVHSSHGGDGAQAWLTDGGSLCRLAEEHHWLIFLGSE